MAKTKQFTIAVEHRPGALAEIARTLGNAKVNILALLGTGQPAGGAIHIVVEDPRRAKKALDEADISYREHQAEEIEIANKPGALAAALEKLAAKGVNLNSIYATASKGGKKAVIVYTSEAKAATAATAA